MLDYKYKKYQINNKIIYIIINRLYLNQFTDLIKINI